MVGRGSPTALWRGSLGFSTLLSGEGGTGDGRHVDMLMYVAPRFSTSDALLLLASGFQTVDTPFVDHPCCVDGSPI